MMSADLPGSMVPTSLTQPEEGRRVDRCGFKRFDRRHAELDQQLEFIGIAAMFGNAGIGPKGNLDARRISLGQGLAGNADPPIDLLTSPGRISIGVLGQPLDKPFTVDRVGT